MTIPTQRNSHNLVTSRIVYRPRRSGVDDLKSRCTSLDLLRLVEQQYEQGYERAPRTNGWRAYRGC